MQGETSVHFEGRIGLVDPLTFYEVHIKMNGADLASDEADFIALIKKVIRAHDVGGMAARIIDSE